MKKLISKLTKPKNLYIDQFGDCWIEVSQIPTIDFESLKTIYGSDHPYNYQMIKPNSIGVWKVVGYYLGRSNPLTRV